MKHCGPSGILVTTSKLTQCCIRLATCHGSSLRKLCSESTNSITVPKYERQRIDQLPPPDRKGDPKRIAESFHCHNEQIDTMVPRTSVLTKFKAEEENRFATIKK